MSNYTVTTDFSVKDGLLSGNPNKLIKGSDFDTEFDNIATAIGTKYDSNNIAGQAAAQAGTDNTVLMTPLRTQEWGETFVAENGGLLEDLHALTDPGADRILFWDDSDNAVEFLAASNGLEIDTNTLGLVDVTPAAGQPIGISSGTFDFDITAVDTIEGNALSAGDLFLVDDGGTVKAIKKEELGLAVQTSQTTQTLAAADMNTIMKFTGTATLTIDENATVDLPIGVPVVLICDHATQEVTVQADTSVTLESIFHPGGTANASDVIKPGGMAVLVQTETDVWQLSGDISDS